MKNIYGKTIVPYKWQQKVDENKDTIIIAPTGSGKSVAAYLWAFGEESNKYEKIIFTAPIKALSNERYLELKKLYGKENVGIITGDVKQNTDARILCMTQEIYTNYYAKNPNQKVIIDEVHYMFQDINRSRTYVDGLVNTPATSKIMLLSATINQNVISYFEKLLHRPLESIIVKKRPVEIQYIGKANYLSALTEYTPSLIFVFSVRGIKQIAEHLLYIRSNKLNYSQQHDEVLQQEIQRFGITNQSLIHLASYGIAIYHGQMKIKEKLFVEKLVRSGIVDVVVGSDALALGINLPVKSVFFGQLAKYYDGPISKREFLQMAGRAGRPNLHEVGYVGFIETGFESDLYTTESLYTKLQNAPLEQEHLLIPVNYKYILHNTSWDDIITVIKHKKKCNTLAELIEQEARYISEYSLTNASFNSIFSQVSSNIKNFIRDIYDMLKIHNNPNEIYELVKNIYYHEMPIDLIIEASLRIHYAGYIDAVDFYAEEVFRIAKTNYDSQKELLQFLRFYNHIKPSYVVNRLEEFENFIKMQDEFAINPDKIEEVTSSITSETSAGMDLSK